LDPLLYDASAEDKKTRHICEQGSSLMSPEKLQLSIFWQKENEYLYCCLHHRLSSICGSHSDLSQQRDVVSNGDSLSVKTGFSGSSYITKNLRKIQNVKISGTDYRLDYRGSILGTGKQFFF
jgi:hypothetical protein